MKNKEFVTSINVTDVQKTDLGGDRGFGSVVRGQFTFDGRIRSDQVGRFNTIVAPGEHAQHVETVFTVKVVKAKHIQWRDMKACPQKSRIESELTALSMEHLSGEVDWAVPENDSENESENTQENKKENESFPGDDTEYDVETERALALEEFANTIPSKYVDSFAEGEADLNKAVAQAAAWSPHKDSKDPLEIPNFLKRS